MVSPETMILSIIGTIFASTGFWAFLTFLVQKRESKESAESQMLKGIGHDMICSRGTEYLQRGSLTKEEYENLHDYLYIPYEMLGGNGTAKKIMLEVEKLPIKDDSIDRRLNK